MLMFLTLFKESLALSRSNNIGHFSSSAFVVNEDMDKTLLVYHNIFDGFIYPGGHADGEANLLGIANREVIEETSVVPTCLNGEKIFALQSNPTKGHIKRGKYVSDHTHYDVLYLMQVKDEDMGKIRILESENSDVKWVPLDECYGEDIVPWVRPINKKIVRKIRTLK